MAERRSPRVSRRALLAGAFAGAGALIAGGSGYRAYRNHTGRDLRPERTRALLGRLQPTGQADLPNIVLIMADDLGFGDLTPYGGRAIATPCLERMAREGTRLTQFYASAPLCTPSRAALLTGRYAVRSHMTCPLFATGSVEQIALSAIGMFPYDVLGIPEDEVCLPELLRRAGYRTGLVGKWHLGDRSPSLPNDKGFDSFYGPLYSNDVQPYAIYRDRQVEIPAPADQDVLTQIHTAEALRFLREHRDGPFFLYLAHPMVHEPIHASAAFRGRSKAGLYGDAVEEVDWSVGQVLDTLRELKIDERTLVIFTSDNGPWWQGSPGATRGRKYTIFEGGSRVPMIARWPGTIPAGRVSGEMAANLDLFPTCLKLAGMPLPDDRIIDGHDILPLLKGEAASPRETFCYYDGPRLAAMRYKNWKYHRRHITENASYWPFSQGPFLFDLERDPNESYSLIESRPEVAQTLVRMMDEWDAQMDANLRGWLPPL